MAKDTNTTAPVKERRPQRTLEQRIAELQAKQAEQNAKAQAAAGKKVELLEAQFAKATARVAKVKAQLDEARAAAGTVVHDTTEG